MNFTLFVLVREKGHGTYLLSISILFMISKLLRPTEPDWSRLKPVSMGRLLDEGFPSAMYNKWKQISVGIKRFIFNSVVCLSYAAVF